MAATNNARVVLVDDDPQVTLALSLVLQDEGYQVETADSGEQTLTSLTHGAPSSSSPICIDQP